MPSEIRKDYVHDRYVIIAPARSKRPKDTERPQLLNPVKPENCVFCPNKVDKLNKVLMTVKSGQQKPWSIKVIANKYPSVATTYPKAYGRQEVIIESPNHFEELEDLSVKQVAEIFKVYAQRTVAISQDKKIDYILIFKNSGGAAGASLQHVHSQIFATQLLPPLLQEKSQRLADYRLKTGRCLYCDVIKKEQRGPRLVAEDKNMIAFCPWASMNNYEIWLMPKRHVDNVTQLTEAERLSLAKFIKPILKKINLLGLAYNYYFHQVVHDQDQHLYLKIRPRGSVWASVEIGAGFIINPISPEQAAKFYRQY